jgi:PilZ domain
MSRVACLPSGFNATPDLNPRQGRSVPPQVREPPSTQAFYDEEADEGRQPSPPDDRKGKTMISTVADRRVHPRLVVVPNRAALDWGSATSEGGHETRLLDISVGGASLESRIMPPPGQSLWLRVESPARTQWVGATFVQSDRQRRIGVRFEGDCPDELMLAATLGIALVF